MPEIRFTAIGSGYFIVQVNGVGVSRHSDEREACQRIANLKLAKPSDEVEFTHNYTVRATLEGTPTPEPGDSGNTFITSNSGVMGIK